MSSEDAAARRPVLILVHGLGTGAAGWRPQVEALSGTREVTSVSLPGYDGTPGPFSLAAAGARVQDAIDAVPSQVPVCLCGLSLGALVTLEVASASHSRLVALVAVAGFATLPEEGRAAQVAMGDWIGSVPEQRFNIDVVANLIKEVPARYRAEAGQALGGFGPTAMADLVREVARFDLTDALPGLNIPVLVAYGENDSINKPLSEDLANRIPRSELAVLPDAGHVANLDAAEAFNALLTAFLTRHNC